MKKKKTQKESLDLDYRKEFIQKYKETREGKNIIEIRLESKINKYQLKNLKMQDTKFNKETVGTGKPSMPMYVGQKEILARPMTRGDYNKYRGWELPANEDGSEKGYLIEYVEGGKPNDDRHKGYISWSPANVFNNAYKVNGKLAFGAAVEALKQGKRISRNGWLTEGNNLFVFMQVPSNVPATVVPKMSSLPQTVKDEYKRRFQSMRKEERENADIRYRNQLCVVLGDNTTYSWTPSVHDVLEEDWIILD